MEDFTKDQWEWINSRPKKVRKVILEYPPNTCYKGIDGKGHYTLYSYGEEKSGKVSLKIIHGKDSFLPGAMVFGITPSDLVKCDCGKWEAGQVREGISNDQA